VIHPGGRRRGNVKPDREMSVQPSLSFFVPSLFYLSLRVPYFISPYRSLLLEGFGAASDQLLLKPGTGGRQGGVGPFVLLFPSFLFVDFPIPPPRTVFFFDLRLEIGDMDGRKRCPTHFPFFSPFPLFSPTGLLFFSLYVA